MIDFEKGGVQVIGAGAIYLPIFDGWGRGITIDCNFCLAVCKYFQGRERKIENIYYLAKCGELNMGYLHAINQM
jgi:hypothetical protein